MNVDKLRILFVGCIVLASLCGAGAFAATSDNLFVAATWFVVGVFLFGFLAMLLKIHAEARGHDS